MKISKNIQNKMRAALIHYQKGKELMKQVDEYFISKGFNIDDLRCGNGCSLEEIEYGNDIIDEFIEEAEKDFSSDIWV